MHGNSVSELDDDHRTSIAFFFFLVLSDIPEHDVTCRFERMIIALSTHALFANTSESLNAIASDASLALVRYSKSVLFWHY